MQQPLITRARKGNPAVEWFFVMLVTSLLLGGTCVLHQQHEDIKQLQQTLQRLNPETAVGTGWAVGDGDVSRSVSMGSLASTTILKVRNENIMVRLTPALKAEFVAALTATATTAGAMTGEEIWGEIEKAAIAFVFPAAGEDLSKTIPPWGTLLPSEGIKAHLVSSGRPGETEYHDLMLWSGDYHFHEDFEAEIKAYRLETTPFGIAMGKVLGNEHFNSADPNFVDFVGAIYNQLSTVLSSQCNGEIIYMCVSYSIDKTAFLSKVLASQEIPAIYTKHPPKNAKTIKVYMRAEDGGYLGAPSHVVAFPGRDTAHNKEPMDALKVVIGDFLDAHQAAKKYSSAASEVKLSAANQENQNALSQPYPANNYPVNNRLEGSYTDRSD